MLHRHLSLILLITYSLFSLACLSWAADPLVRTLTHTYHYLLSPATEPLAEEMERWGEFGRNTLRLLRVDKEYLSLEERWRRDQLDRKRYNELVAENMRLSALLDFPRLPGYTHCVARVFSRDSVDWFHSIMVNKGRKEGVRISDPVVALQKDREVLVGRVADVYDDTCQVLLVTDPLSAVSASAGRTGEQGAVEGMGSRWLEMNYLLSDADIRPGDEVLTEGLGGIFPAGIFVGTVESVGQETRESFKRALLVPAVRLSKLEEVIVLMPEGPRGEAPHAATNKPAKGGKKHLFIPTFEIPPPQ